MAHRTPILAGNWKMNLTPEEARDLASRLATTHTSPDTLPLVAESTRQSSVRFGAQNVHPEERGAFTGEVSVGMVRALGGQLALAGHSERRHVFGEENGFIARKVAAIIDAGLFAVLCVGETLEEREEGRTESIVTDQLRAGLSHVQAQGFGRIVIAYEPVWAIGTGRTATPDQAQAVHHLARGFLRERYNEEIAGTTRILYGGSVNPDNVSGLLNRPDIDGALVGGASLSHESFSALIQNSGYHS